MLTFKAFYLYECYCHPKFFGLSNNKSQESRRIITLYMHGVAAELIGILFVSETFRQMLESAEHY